MFWEACKDFEGVVKIWQQLSRRRSRRSTNNLVLGFWLTYTITEEYLLLRHQNMNEWTHYWGTLALLRHIFSLLKQTFLPMPLVVAWVNILTFYSPSPPSPSSLSPSHHQHFVSLRYRKHHGTWVFRCDAILFILVHFFIYFKSLEVWWPTKDIAITLLPSTFWYIFSTKLSLCPLFRRGDYHTQWNFSA